MRDLVEDERGDWYNLEGQPLVGALLSSRTKTLQDVEQVRHAHTCCCGGGEGLPKCARLEAGRKGGLACAPALALTHTLRHMSSCASKCIRPCYIDVLAAVISKEERMLASTA